MEKSLKTLNQKLQDPSLKNDNIYLFDNIYGAGGGLGVWGTGITAAAADRRLNLNLLPQACGQHSYSPGMVASDLYTTQACKAVPAFGCTGQQSKL